MSPSQNNSRKHGSSSLFRGIIFSTLFAAFLVLIAFRNKDLFLGQEQNKANNGEQRHQQLRLQEPIIPLSELLALTDREAKSLTLNAIGSTSVEDTGASQWLSALPSEPLRGLTAGTGVGVGVVPHGHIPATSTASSSDAIATASSSAAASTTRPAVGTNVTDLNRRQECSAKYGKRSFFKLSEVRSPPMLYTFPGSGNTWCRLLIEYGIGIYSGSVYNDQSLMQSLPGEYTCNKRLSVIKVHPHTHPFTVLRDGGFRSDGPQKCVKGGVLNFKRAVLLVRNPFDSIWSEFKRRASKSHVGGIERKLFDWPKWQANAAALSNDYYTMWRNDYTGIENTFKKEDILYIRYEDLKNEKTRVQVMAGVASFLGVSVGNDQLECSFLLASQSSTHRAQDGPRSMSKEEAYTKPLSCKMWLLFSKFAEKHGYGVINGYDCSEFTQKDAIKNIRIGSAGQYDKSYVPPGEKLVDFGGREGFEPGALSMENVQKKIQKRNEKEARKKKILTGNELGPENTPNNPELKVQGSNMVGKGVRTPERSPPLGMTLEQAEGVAGVGGLGKVRPAWQ